VAINQIEHRRTDEASPETNGFCERFHRTVKEEFFQVAFRKTLYESGQVAPFRSTFQGAVDSSETPDSRIIVGGNANRPSQKPCSRRGAIKRV
jgi:hypothetical protein